MYFQRVENAVGAKDGLYYDLEDFFEYMISHTPLKNDLILLTHAEYCDIPYSIIQATFEVITIKLSTSDNPGDSYNVTNPVATQGLAAPTNKTPASHNSYSHIVPSLSRILDLIRCTNF